MASQSLYRKWRSQTFSDLIGQEAVTRTLLNAVRDGRLAHAYLFCGPRGTGKTSSARLLAKAVNCANPKDGEPCNECISCREIAAGTSPDVIEIDAASNNSVDDIRELRGNVNLIGSGGKYRVYILDEAHMLSPAAWNALLKTLEEPPPHIIFVFATTEATKVLPTVVSRCQRFDFRRIGMRDIVRHLRHIADAEGLTLEPAAADLLARAAQGGMRDALSLLDQAMAFSGTQIGLDRVRAMLGLADPGALRRLVACVADDQPAEGLAIINEMVESGADLRQLTGQLAEEFRALVLARAGADVAHLMDLTDDEAREVAALAKRFSLEELTACARIFTRGDAPVRGLPMPQLALEVTFLECLTIKRGGGAPTIAATTPRTLESVSQRAAPAQPSAPNDRAAPKAASSAAPQPSPTYAAPAVPPQAPGVEELDLDALDAQAGMPSVTRSSAPESPQRPAPVPPPAFEPEDALPVYDEEPEVVEAMDGDAGEEDDASALLRRIRGDWMLIKRVCKQKSMSVAALLNSTHPVHVDDGEQPTVVLEASHSFHLEKLREPKSKQAVEWALEQVLSRPVRVRLAQGGSSGNGGISGNGRGGPGPRGGDGPFANGSSPQNRNAGNSGNSYVREGGASGSVSASAYGSTARAVSAEHESARAPVATAQAPARPSRPEPPDVQPSNITPFRSPASRNEPRPARSLEEEVRADPVVQALTRAGMVEIADVRPLDDEDTDW